MRGIQPSENLPAFGFFRPLWARLEVMFCVRTRISFVHCTLLCFGGPPGVLSFLPAYASYLSLARGGIVAVCAVFLLVRRGVGDRTICFFVDAEASYGSRFVR